MSIEDETCMRTGGRTGASELDVYDDRSSHTAYGASVPRTRLKSAFSWRSAYNGSIIVAVAQEVVPYRHGTEAFFVRGDDGGGGG